MLGRTRFRVANALAAIGNAPAAGRFAAALADPAAAQRRVLARILDRNAGSAFGRHYGFERLACRAAFKAAVPPADYDALSPWIGRALAGEAGVLTSEPILMFEKTSGSTRAAKYIPYTASLRSEFQAATAAWLFDLWRAVPGLRGGGAYWSVSPAAQEREFTPGGHPVGFADDTEYFDPLTRWILNQLLVVPGTAAHAGSMDEVRYTTLRLLLASEDLALFSVWNPSFLTLLVRAIDPFRDRLLRDIRDGTLSAAAGRPASSAQPPFRPAPRRAEELERLLGDGAEKVDFSRVWPRLALISCWTDASAAMFLPDMQRSFPGVPIQGKGLLSTEGVVSVPVVGHPGAALAVTSHFLEFVPEGADPAGEGTVLAHELDPGGRYSVLLTTGGGLYRYATHDVIEVVGRIRRTPLVRFAGKADHVSDLCGEKLAAMHVERILAGLVPPGTAFALLAPEQAPAPHYVLFVEGPSLPDPGDLDANLRENVHYAYCRDLGQLAPPAVVPVVEGQRKYLAGCEALGQKPGNVKPAALHRALGWAERLA